MTRADLGALRRHATQSAENGQPVGLIVLDGVAEALALQGCDENLASDVARWIQAYPRQLANDGHCVVLVDHVVKATERRGRWARGSGHKLAAISGAAYALEVIEGFSRRGSGRGLLRVAKDRPGAVGPIGTEAAAVSFEIADGGRRVAVLLDPPGVGRGDASATPPSPFETMEVVSKVLEASPRPRRSREVADALPGLGTRIVVAALDALQEAASVEVDVGPRGGTRFRSVTPFRVAVDADHYPDEATAADSVQRNLAAEDQSRGS